MSDLPDGHANAEGFVEPQSVVHKLQTRVDRHMRLAFLGVGQRTLLRSTKRSMSAGFALYTARQEAQTHPGGWLPHDGQVGVLLERFHVRLPNDGIYTK